MIKIWKFFVTPPSITGSAIELKLFSGIHILLKVFCFEAFVNSIVGKSFMNKSTSRCDFQWEIFYRLLLAINSNIDFIVCSIDLKLNNKRSRLNLKRSMALLWLYKLVVSTTLDILTSDCCYHDLGFTLASYKCHALYKNVCMVHTYLQCFTRSNLSWPPCNSRNSHSTIKSTTFATS